jgi:hypothetical protein
LPAADLQRSGQTAEKAAGLPYKAIYFGLADMYKNLPGSSKNPGPGFIQVAAGGFYKINEK